MDFVTHLQQALINLLNAKLRSFLAILGILVGTGSVVALIMAGELGTAHALAQFKTLGTNIVSVGLSQRSNSSKAGVSQTSFKMDVLPLLYQAVPQATLIAPYVTLGQSIYVAGQSGSGTVIGATQNFSKVIKLHLSEGRMINSVDNLNMYCDVGEALAKKIRSKGVDPIGQVVLVGHDMFTIVGVLKSWKPNFFLYSDIDNGVLVPINTAQMLSSNADVRNIIFRLIENPNLDAAKKNIVRIFLQVLPSVQTYIRDPGQIISIVHKQQMTFSMLLAAIASISLLVGGIGVMNIMLVSVVERRRSIGVRMAIGARRIDIQKMFIIEAVILTLFGGFMGVIVGSLISYILAIINGWAFFINTQPVVLGFSVSVLVGILSGWYPALRASRLNPIQILTS